MDWRKYIDFIKQDIKRSYAVTKGLEIERTYLMRIYIVFALNVIGIIGFAVLKEEFPVSVFVGLWVISACIIGNILWQVFAKEIQHDMPGLFETETQKRGKPLHNFKCRLVFIGRLHFRGLGCGVYIYADEILLKFGKYCLIIDAAQQIKIEKFLLAYRVEFAKDCCYVQCHANQKQADILQQWINGNN